MNDAGQVYGIPLFADEQSNAQAGVMAALSEREFGWAQVIIPDLSGYHDYADWLDRREGFQIGLAMAGVEVGTIPVALAPFLAWCRLTQTQPSERALDAFASTLFFFREPPTPRALPMVREDEFLSHAQTVEAFAPYDSFAHWRRHRAARHANMLKAGVRVEALPIKVSDFVEWSRCLGESTSEARLDAYATLVLEFLLQDPEA